jgi:hypothetical protein
VSYYIALGLPMIMSSTAFADGGSVTQVESFIQSIIKIVAGLAGLSI